MPAAGIAELLLSAKHYEEAVTHQTKDYLCLS